MAFVALKAYKEEACHINAEHIDEIEGPTNAAIDCGAGAIIRLESGRTYWVKETPEEVLKKIKEACDES